MNDGVPNLRLVGRSTGHVLDGTDRCSGHCLHVELIWRETRSIKRLAWVVLIAIAGLFVKDLYPVVSNHGRESIPLTHLGERLAPDRIDEPMR